MVKPTRYVSMTTLITLLVLMLVRNTYASWSPKQYTSESSAVTNSIPYKEAKGPDK